MLAISRKRWASVTRQYRSGSDGFATPDRSPAGAKGSTNSIRSLTAISPSWSSTLLHATEDELDENHNVRARSS